MAVRVSVLTDGHVNTPAEETPGATSVIRVVRTQTGPISTNATQSMVKVVNGAVLLNAVVSPTPPAAPYQNMVWIEV